MCAFRIPDSELNWKIGRVLHFANYLAKTKSSQQYHGLSANVSDKNIGVLCSWYAITDTVSRKFSLSFSEVPHVHVPISSYLCTLPVACFENLESANIANNIGKMNSENMKILTMKNFTLTVNVMSSIQNIFQDSNPPSVLMKKKSMSQDKIKCETQCPSNNDCWTKCGRILLTKKDKQQN